LFSDLKEPQWKSTRSVSRRVRPDTSSSD
jgi:hypothetical protein